MSTKNSNKNEKNVLVNKTSEKEPVKGLKVVETATTKEGEVIEQHTTFVVSPEITKKVADLYKEGKGAKFSEIAEALNLTYYKAKEGKNTKGTPVVDVDGKLLDFHAFLRLVNVTVVTRERAANSTSAKGKSKDERLKAYYNNFVSQVKELTSDEKLLKAIDDLSKHIERVAAALIDSDKLNTETKSTFAQAAGLLSFEQQKELKGMSAEQISNDFAAFLEWQKAQKKQSKKAKVN